MDIPDQRGRTAVITGGNTGIGYATAKALAERGATVVLACRSPARAADAASRLADAAPDVEIDVVALDLARLESIHAAADAIRHRHPRVDLLINNAGLMMPPYGQTADGFEQQFGINHLGHFALTAELVELMAGVPGSRIVTLSSSAHRQGRIDLDDPNFEHRRYRAPAAYGQSKLANVLFSYEVQRRLTDAGAPTVAVAVEPGIVPTELQRHVSGAMAFGVNTVTRLIGQPDAAHGALATLRAATDPAVRAGEYYGPNGRLMRASGAPVRCTSSAISYDLDLASRLWTLSQQLTGVTFTVPC
jgi:NAD(P)-dependent dehydrogenase (short-subunit alcohol dehydrogenase family)